MGIEFIVDLIYLALRFLSTAITREDLDDNYNITWHINKNYNGLATRSRFPNAPHLLKIVLCILK